MKVTFTIEVRVPGSEAEYADWSGLRDVRDGLEDRALKYMGEKFQVHLTADSKFTVEDTPDSR